MHVGSGHGRLGRSGNPRRGTSSFFLAVAKKAGALTFLFAVSLQAVRTLPPGASGLRYAIRYAVAADTRFPRTRFFVVALFNTNQEFSYTIGGLVRNTEYTVQVRAEFRYRECFAYLQGNLSDPVTFRTSNEGINNYHI